MKVRQRKGKKNSFYVASLYVGVSIFYVVACAQESVPGLSSPRVAMACPLRYFVGVSTRDICVVDYTMDPTGFGKLQMMCSSYGISYSITNSSSIYSFASKATASPICTYQGQLGECLRSQGHLHHRPFSSDHCSRKTQVINILDKTYDISFHRWYIGWSPMYRLSRYNPQE